MDRIKAKAKPLSESGFTGFKDEQDERQKQNLWIAAQPHAAITDTIILNS